MLLSIPLCCGLDIHMGFVVLHGFKNCIDRVLPLPIRTKVGKVGSRQCGIFTDCLMLSNTKQTISLCRAKQAVNQVCPMG